MRKTFMLACVLVAALSCATAFAQEEPEAVVSSGDIVLNQNFPVASVKKIEVNLQAEAVRFISSAEDALNVTVKSNYQEKNPLIVLDGKTLKVSQPEKKIKLADRTCEVIVTLPAKMKVSELDVSVASGSVVFETISVDDIEVELGKGTFTSDYINVAKSFSLSAGDGSANILGVTAKEIELEVKKGNVEIGSSDIKKFSVKNEKGNAALTLNAAFAKESSLEASSGTITLILPSTTVLNTKTTIGKGSFHSDFATDTKGMPLKVKVGNGSVNISKL